MEGTGEVRRGGGWNWSSVDLEAEKKKKIDSFKNLHASDSVWLEMRGTQISKS